MTNALKKYGYFFLLALIFALGLILRLKGLFDNPSFWHDECSLGYNIIHKTYSGFFKPLTFYQIAPPFFMIMSKLCTQFFGVSDFVLRLTPFFFGIASLGLFFALATKVFQNKLTIILSTYLFAINQNLVNYSSEFKHYSCDVFCTLLCIYLFLKLLSKKVSLKKTLTYALILSILVWFSFVSVFAIAAGICALAIKQLKQKNFDLKPILILIVPILISLVLYSKFYLINTYITNHTGMEGYWQSGFIAKNLSNLISLFAFNINYIFFPIKFILFAFLFILSGAYALTKKDSNLGLFLLLIIFFTCFASWLGIYPFQKRAILFLAPIFLIFVSASFELINPRNKKLYFSCLILFFTMLVPAILFTHDYLLTPKMSRGFHAREMMQKLSELAKPNDIIIVNYNSDSEFAYYSNFYPLKNKVYQEKTQGNPQKLIKLLKRRNHYWLFMPHRPSIGFENWMDNHKDAVLFNMKWNSKPGSLRYVYFK